MKRLLILSLLLLVFGCERENPPTPAGPPPPPPGPDSNWVCIGSDTIWLDQFRGYRDDTLGAIVVLAADTDELGGLALFIPVGGVDSIYMTGTNSSVSATNIGPHYCNLQMTMEVTRYDNVGGLIEGEFNGVGFDCSNSSIQVPIFGVFSVIRGPNE